MAKPDTNKFRPLKNQAGPPVKKQAMSTMTITAYNDNTTSVNGPIDHPELLLTLVGRGLVAAGNHLAKKKAKDNGGIVPVKSNLILPGMK